MFRKIVKKIIPRGLFRAIEPTGHLLEAVLWQILLGFPARGLKVIGVTGTNGKTTTCYMAHQMMHDAGLKVGLMTTVGYGAGMDIHPQMTHMTTMPTRGMLRRIKQLRQEGIEWLILETTSHALAQNRVWGVPYSIGVMTNLTHEHLAYHRTFARYRTAKVKLFKLVSANHSGKRLGILNADDPSAAYFAKAVPKSIRYGTHEGADVRAMNIQSTSLSNKFDLDYDGQRLKMKTQMPGTFNVYNALAAASVGLAIGLTSDQIEKGIAALRTVEGRMTRVDKGQDFTVIVDYAHSPDSFEKLFVDMKPLVKGRLIVVFGSQGGTGDIGKRALQGRLAGQYADLVVITEEDDRGEDGQSILETIAEATEKAGKIRDSNMWLVHDRSEAIEFALGKAGANDTVLLLGKGHEKTIERGADGEEPWDEVGAAEQALVSLAADRAATS
jgi:UDP-N-acetylmuramoyl-L-alanyl-D-glutamate--2,6-diaminopimelate ligase